MLYINISIFNEISYHGVLGFKINDLYRSADFKLNKILKLFSSSSSLSDFEILALISSIDVKLKLSLIEDWVPLLRSFESLIKDIQKSKGIVLSEVLRQYNQYFKSKLIIEEEIYRNKIELSEISRYSLKFIHFLKMLNASISRYLLI